MIKCPTCGAPAPEGLTHCPECIADVGQAPPEIAAMLKTVLNIMDLCGYDKKTKSCLKTMLSQAEKMKGIKNA
ncbi:MAG: hypothetical protein FWC70_05585 [Defluviitaleaceae bacterium]|nr:hypothetical protein [Defluviitaleaceae bacterium]